VEIPDWCPKNKLKNLSGDKDAKAI
jgi:hypothetical protein